MSVHYEKVFRSPINTSIAKNLYSFPKTERFEKTATSTCKKGFYDLKNGFSFSPSRTTAFGFGERSSILNQQQGPEPATYRHNSSVFVQNKSKKRGYSFGGQQKVCFPYEEFNPKNPGPGNYESSIQKIAGRRYNHHLKGYSIRSKYEDPLQGHKNTLGPGQYRVCENLSPIGNYTQSKFKNSLCGKIGKSRRFGSDHTESPGPGAYKNQNQMNRTGFYFDSRMGTSVVSGFQGTSRPPINQKSETPAPGTYYHFSEFGSTQK